MCTGCRIVYELINERKRESLYVDNNSNKEKLGNWNKKVMGRVSGYITFE